MRVVRQQHTTLQGEIELHSMGRVFTFVAQNLIE